MKNVINPLESVSDPTQETPVNNFIWKILLDANKQVARTIQLDLKRSNDPAEDRFIVCFEIDGRLEDRFVIDQAWTAPGSITPTEFWSQLVQRIKDVAGVVDTEPESGIDGEFSILMSSKGRTADFHLRNNPDPRGDEHLTIFCQALEQ